MKKNFNFFQISKSIKSENELVSLTKYQQAMEIYLRLSFRMNDINALIISVKALSELTGMSTRSVLRAIKYLKEHNFITVLKSGTQNVYVLNPDIVWNSSYSKRKHCKFQANVVLTESENKKLIDENSRTQIENTPIPNDLLNEYLERFKEEEYNVSCT